MAQPLDKRLLKAVASMAELPMVAIGSGGSFSSADFVASLHRDHAGKVSDAMTPLAAAARIYLRHAALVLLTAGGKNPDVLGVFRNAVQREPRRFLVFCTTEGSPLAKNAAKHAFVDVVEISLPTGKDGLGVERAVLPSGPSGLWPSTSPIEFRTQFVISTGHAQSLRRCRVQTRSCRFPAGAAGNPLPRSKFCPPRHSTTRLLGRGGRFRRAVNLRALPRRSPEGGDGAS